MIEGAIFDLDGTLLDSMRVWDTLAVDCLRSIGVTPKPDLMQSIATMNMTEAVEFIREDYGLTQSCEELAQGAVDILRAFYRREAEAKPGVADFLRALAEKGVRMIVATASEKEGAEIALKRNGIFDYFEAIVTCDEAGKGKSGPEVYRRALEILGTAREKTPVFEDTYYAAQTATLDGFPVVAVYDAAEKNQAGIKALAAACIADYGELESFWKMALAR